MDDLTIVVLLIAAFTIVPLVAAWIVKRWLRPWLAATLVAAPFVAWAFWLFDGDAVALVPSLPPIAFALLGAHGMGLVRTAAGFEARRRR